MPGCPPSAESLLYGILQLQKKIRHEVRKKDKAMNLNELNKLINSELTNKIIKSEIENDEIKINIDVENLFSTYIFKNR